MLLLMLLLMMMVPRAGRLVDRSRMSTRWRWRWSRRRRRRRHHTERCEADGNKEMRTCGCTYIFRRISWKKRQLGVGVKWKKKEEKGKHNNTQETGTETGRRSIHIQKRNACGACLCVCVCVFDIWSLLWGLLFIWSALTLSARQTTLMSALWY